MTLDLLTLHFSSAVSWGAYVVVFLLLALGQRRLADLWQWMGAMGASMLGSLIMTRVDPDELPPVLVTMVVNGL